jgi:histidinol-phosphate aminotransferase
LRGEGLVVTMPISGHGGPDAQGIPRWDFSTNANACGPAPIALSAVRDADPTRYPDPAHTRLRERLAAFHGVAADRIVIAASASEFIHRMSLAVASLWPQASVHVPAQSYADVGRAAAASGLRPRASPGGAQLVWHTEPGSPSGRASSAPATREGAVLVIDAAYAPLRLEGAGPPHPASAWVLMSPNKALGLTGVRAAYAVAPAGVQALCERLAAFSPSWPVGAHGVAMLEAWVREGTQAWLRDSLGVLRGWKRQQVVACESLGWVCEPSAVPFFLARPAEAHDLAALREVHGIKLRDTASFGLAGRVRVSVQAPEAQRALVAACRALESKGPRR